MLDDGARVDPRIQRIVRSYGITGMVYTLTEYGLLGFVLISLIFLIFVRMCWDWYKRETDGYWKAIATGSVVLSVYNGVIFLTYNTLPILGDTIVPVYFYAMATTNIRLKQLLKAGGEVSDQLDANTVSIKKKQIMTSDLLRSLPGKSVF
ncbi:hypothetical protein E2P64_06155 [Candidatus Bathyarchaeota archaeon]|nr:hypothetical protein E2P64_06155 [Candidatus Bathyarchaeota archaeon]